MDWTLLEPQLAHFDNAKRIQALAQLKTLLQDTQAVNDADHLAQTLRQSLKSNNAHVAAAALACLPPLFPLLVQPDQPPSTSANSLRHAFTVLLPLDKLGDAKQHTRELALEGLVSAAHTCLQLGAEASGAAGGPAAKGKEGPWQVLERGVHEHGFGSKSAKAREQSLRFLAAIRCPPADSNLPLPPLRPFTPLLLPLLSDSDSAVRSLALHTCIAVFTHPTVTPAAKADLKKAMAALDVAKKVQDQILSAVLGGAAPAAVERSPSQGSLSSLGATSDSSRGAAPARSTRSGGSAPGASDAAPRRLTRSQAAAQSSSSSTPHTPSLLASLPATAFPTDPSAAQPASAEISPVYIASERDLRAEFDAMKPGFEGKETEQNWQVRDRSVAAVRGMLLGGVAQGELQAVFVQCVRGVLDGIIRTSSSLRTTLAISTLTLISELATSLPPSQLDQLLDPLLSHLLSMASQTKKIVGSASQSSAATLMTHAPYHLRTVQLVAALLSEKTVSARQFGAQHLVTVLDSYGRTSRAALDSTGGTDELERAIAKALADPNAQVRETARRAYWAFVERGWADRAERVREALDASARKLLDKVKPAQAPAPAAAPAAATVRNGGAAVSAPSVAGTPSGKKPTMRELMAAKRKEAQAAQQAEEAAARDEGADEAPTETPERVQTVALDAASPAASVTPQATPTRMAFSPNATPARSGAEIGDAASPSASALLSLSPARQTPSRSPAARTPAYPQAAAQTPSSFSAASSADFASPSRPSRQHDLVPDPVVDEALREQALQAEQAAERLLELTQDEAEEQQQSPSRGSFSPASGASGLGTPVSSRTAPAQSAALHTPAPNPALRRLAGGAVFKDSPDARDGSGAGTKGTWWIRRSETLRAAPPAEVPRVEDSSEARDEVERLVEGLRAMSVGPGELRRLSALSREWPVRDVEEEEEEADERSDGIDSPSKVANGGASTAARFWGDERRFERVYEGLKAFLLRPDAPEHSGQSRDVALLLLKDLVENQLPCFVGEEAGVFDLLFKLREDPSRTSIAATEAIATSFTSRLEPLYGLGSLVPSLTSYLASTTAAPDVRARSCALGLRLMGAFFELLPAEVLEDVLPQSRDLLKQALNDSTAPDLRRAALMALVSAQVALSAGDDAAASSAAAQSKLDALVGGLEKDQANLLAYYAAKRAA
ncbi:uncharacterized protein JCM10292_003216 [Rhodotorula paludigena]|uniref:uncharacterized protein n=1 Tax=Rhodotorula paludigena TaxID=86838 RepID=UPI003170E5C5